MNIDINESIFRYIIPPSILALAIFLVDQRILIDFANKYQLFNNILFSIILFFAIGFSINSVGVLVTRFIVDRVVKPKWHSPEGEINDWRKMAKEEKQVGTKVERRWSFYTINLNAFLALITSLFFIHSWNCYTGLVIGSLSFVFFSLALLSYRDVRAFSEFNNGT